MTQLATREIQGRLAPSALQVMRRRRRCAWGRLRRMKTLAALALSKL
eukprot:CAMPEP_0180823274 /NCGR_PEP_ID=MMETSP1038_2-20121128/71808_1 /TAXON_ID=632150 /ORGANISM="Azadinium spinosum, Strain 3D9" /LENGTH=46 /DNA_ID= /DNA_START= /DNA_END= /DNA_ORIENTATION=